MTIEAPSTATLVAKEVELLPPLNQSTDSEHIMMYDKTQEHEMNEDMQKHISAEDTIYHKLRKLTASQPFAHILLALNILLYGGFCVIAPASISHFPSVLFASFRTGIIAVTVLPLSLIIDRTYKFREFEEDDERHWLLKMVLSKIPRRRELLFMLTCGIIQAFNIGTYIISLGLTSPTIVSIISPVATVFTCLIAVFLKREGRSLLKFAGVFCAVLGAMGMLIIAAIFDDSGKAEAEKSSRLNVNSLIACCLMVMNALGSAIILNVQKYLLDDGVPPFTLTGYCLSIATLCMSVVGAFFGSQFHPSIIPATAWFGLIYAGIVVGSVSFVISGYAARIASATVVSVYSTTMPVVSAVFLYIFLGQTVSWMVGVGGIVIMSGVVMVALGKRRESQQAAKEASQQQQQHIELANLSLEGHIEPVEAQHNDHIGLIDQSESTDPVKQPTVLPDREALSQV